MDDIQMSPRLIKELKKFEAKKQTYMTKEEKEELQVVEEKNSKTFKYFFQHPNFRLLTVAALIILNFYMFAEDPTGHSVTDCEIAVVGNIFSFIYKSYPDNAYSILKTILWIFAIVFGIIVGKCFIHHYLFCHKFHIKLFTKEGQGSWLVIFFFTLCVLYYETIIYNAFLTLIGTIGEVEDLYVTSNMHIENKTFMKAVAVLIWSGDMLTGWMILDMMLQERRYSTWLKPLKRWWLWGLNRVIAFWFMAVTIFIIFIVGIATDFMKWDELSHGFASTNELARSFLASVIVILDFLVIMQDWDFPHFNNAVELKLPGIPTTDVEVRIPSCLSVHSNKIQYSGKWFYYGILLIITIQDMYMWKKQIFYDPFDYGQYTDPQGHIYTVLDKEFLDNVTKEKLSYEYRWTPQPVFNSTTNETILYGPNDFKVLTKYHGYSYRLKAIAFLPGIVCIFLFSYLTYTFAQDEGEHEKQVREWYESKFVKRRKSNRVGPIEQDSDSDSDSEDEIQIIRIDNARKFDYIFQHPIARLLICYTGVFLSWLLIAEDPIGHSHAEATVDVLGNAYSLLFSRYPSKLEFVFLKVMMCVGAAITAYFLGKVLLHNIIFHGWLKIKLFARSQGSWICTFIMFIISLYVWSLAYNRILDEIPDMEMYKISNHMDIKFKTFIKGIAVMSFITHFILTLMVTDTIFQEQHYPEWASDFRKIWQRDLVRITVVWVVGIGMTVAAVVAITVDFINWDNMSKNLVPTDELGRAYLAMFIIIFDLLIITQDWEFPRFTINPKIKLPGLTASNYRFKFCFIDLELQGKWFTYGLLGLILIIDIYNFKNQITYEPNYYEQYTYADTHIRSITEEKYFLNNDITKLKDEDVYGLNFPKVNAKYTFYNDDTKGTVYLPLTLMLLGCIAFGISKSNYILAMKN